MTSEDLRASTRRDFMRISAAAGGGLMLGMSFAGGVHAAGTETLKVALIGCGGRGTGAAKDALMADSNVRLTVMADVFADHLDLSYKTLSTDAEISSKVDVPNDQKFIGFDAFAKAMATDVDVVLLTTPPHFRPEHLKAAVEAGKHVFCEKPVAVDAPGVRSVMASAEAAKQKGLCIVSGLCWRYDTGVRETIKQIQDGAIGEVLAIQENYNAGGLWSYKREPSWSDMEYQMRNWLYYTWLSGDHNVEQHIHSLDKAQWILGDVHPIRATGLGGRQVRTDPLYGHIFDHHAVVYEYAGGKRVFAFCRQQDGCSMDVEDYVIGTKGRCQVLKHEIEGEKSWRYRGGKDDASMYRIEHQELFAAIRKGEPINNGDYMSKSTMMAILGRMATYTGQTINWDDALASEVRLGPTTYQWGDAEFAEVAKPGITQFA